MMITKQKTFSFLDESGLMIPTFPQKTKKRNFSAIGILKHPNPFKITQNLHKCHEQLCSTLKKDNTRIEFSFKGITERTTPVTLKALSTLEKDPDWTFHIIYFDTTKTNFHKYYTKHNKWQIYLDNVMLVIQKTLNKNEETVLLMDFLRCPTKEATKLKQISHNTANIYAMLQVISHGVLLIQMVDILLGGFLYHKGNFSDKMGLKTEVAKRVMDIKNSVGNKRFKITKRTY